MVDKPYYNYLFTHEFTLLDLNSAKVMQMLPVLTLYSKNLVNLQKQNMCSVNIYKFILMGSCIELFLRGLTPYDLWEVM